MQESVKMNTCIRIFGLPEKELKSETVTSLITRKVASPEEWSATSITKAFGTEKKMS